MKNTTLLVLISKFKPAFGLKKLKLSFTIPVSAPLAL
jgi:hypothetical protein